MTPVRVATPLELVVADPTFSMDFPTVNVNEMVLPAKGVPPAVRVCALRVPVPA